MTRITPTIRFARLALVVLALASVPAAMAAKGGNGNAGKTTTPTGSFTLDQPVIDGVAAQWGEHITFHATSTATYYFVSVTCSNTDGVPVYRQDKGFYVGWPLDQRDFTLMSAAWTGGAATCDAVLYSQYSDGSNYQPLDKLSFSVAA